MFCSFGIAAVFVIIIGAGNPTEEVAEEPKQEVTEEVEAVKEAAAGEMSIDEYVITASRVYWTEAADKSEYPAVMEVHIEKMCGQTMMLQFGITEETYMDYQTQMQETGVFEDYAGLIEQPIKALHEMREKAEQMKNDLKALEEQFEDHRKLFEQMENALKALEEQFEDQFEDHRKLFEQMENALNEFRDASPIPWEGSPAFGACA